MQRRALGESRPTRRRTAASNAVPLTATHTHAVCVHDTCHVRLSLASRGIRMMKAPNEERSRPCSPSARLAGLRVQTHFACLLDPANPPVVPSLCALAHRHSGFAARPAGLLASAAAPPMTEHRRNLPPRAERGPDEATRSQSTTVNVWQTLATRHSVSSDLVEWNLAVLCLNATTAFPAKWRQDWRLTSSAN